MRRYRSPAARPSRDAEVDTKVATARLRQPGPRTDATEASSEAQTLHRRAVAVGITPNRPPAATDVPSAISPWHPQGWRRFYTGVIVATRRNYMCLGAGLGALGNNYWVRALVD